ncbi:DEAD/DEAH box helicase [Asanoa sp. NPDC049518]|uniref:DEAD/DEAH box helicase n=1 Tax=unclassified Asanoa TaxID=2685164 RepID=UPI003446E97A
MIHGVWTGGRLGLWGEQALPDVPGEPATLTLALPTADGRPVPASDEPPADATLASWPVSVVLLGPGPALELLADLDDLDWTPGSDLRYLAVVAAYANGLFNRGRLLPALVTADGAHAARWRPVLTGRDAAAFRELAAAMPGAVRAVDAAPPGQVLRELLDAFTDAAARRALPERLLLGHRPGPKAPVADRWMRALTADDPSVTATTTQRPELAALRTALDAWHRAAHQANEPVRVCFRLVEPLPTTDRWDLEFALQSVDDPSLYVPAEVIWAGQRVPGLPARPDETLLAGLGRAVRLFPPLDEALREAQPTESILDTAAAFTFLRQAAPLLQAAGYGVQLPAWAGRKSLGLKLTTRTKSTANGGKALAAQGVGKDQLVDFKVDLMVGDEEISAADLHDLARLKVPLLRVKGRWVELDDRQLTAAIRAVEQHRTGELTVAEVLGQVAAGGEEDLPLVAVDADGWLGDLLSGDADHRLQPTPTPPSFQGTLRPYQERGLSWLDFLSRLGIGGILADDMGLGKSPQTLALLLAERERGVKSSTLLVCPMSLVSNWRKEAEKFAPSLDVYVHHGATRDVGRLGHADLVITTYGTALRDLDALRQVEWGRVVCDEAQAIKNSATRQSQAVRAIPAGTRLALTGTPVENHLAELWSIMDFANPGLLGPAKTFRRRYQEPIEVRQDEDAAAALKRATGPFVLRRLKTDKTIISDLPEKLEMKVWCPLTTEQAALYQAVVDDMMNKIGSSAGIERRGNVLAAMTRLKQVCNHPAHLLRDGSKLAGRSGKLARLQELAEEIVEEGDKGLVFTQYAEFGTLLQPYLAAHLDRPVLWLHGGLSKQRRDELVTRFQNDPEPMIFLLSLKAAGTGLNLTAANHVIHVDRWWNPAVEDQATDRAYRIGQARNVQVRKFICTGTIEERVDEMIERKKALAQRVVGTGEEWLTELSTEELRDLFALDPKAVG